jgi:hypothetical protein
MGEFDQGRLGLARLRGVFRRREVDERVSAVFVLRATDLDKPKDVAEKIQRAFEIANPDHGVKEPHLVGLVRRAILILAPRLVEGTPLSRNASPYLRRRLALATSRRGATTAPPRAAAA